jgi:hypothetical protein
MSFQQELTLARVRQTLRVLWLAQLTLFVVVFALSFLSGRVFDEWILITINVVAALLVFFFWLLPSIRFATTFVDFTTTRIISRGGLFGRVRREVSLSEVTGIEYSRARGIVILLGEQPPLLLTRMSRAKALAEELRRTLAK